MRIAITGSNGFIGKELVSHFLLNGDEVVMLQRKSPEAISVGATYQRYDLGTPEVLPDLNGVDVLIHTAYMPFKAKNGAGKKNIDGTLALYHLCLSTGVQFIFLSSMSAHKQALSQYGRHKFELEQKLDTTKCLILKLGLVIGKEGLFSRIYSSLQKRSVAVLVGGGNQPVQPVYIGDVVKVIDKCAFEKRTGIYTIALNKVYTMRALLSAIAARVGKKPIFISIPYWMVNFGVAAIEFLHLPFPISNENVLGLKQLTSIDSSADLKKLDINLLDLEESIRAITAS